MTEPKPTAEEALARVLHAVFEGFVYRLPPDDPDWDTYAREVLGRLQDAGFSVWDLRHVYHEESDDELVLRDPAGSQGAATGDASEASQPDEPGDTPKLTLDEYHLLAARVLDGPIELLDGVVELAGEPFVFSPAQARAAAALGIRVWSALDSVLQDPQARASLIEHLRDAGKGGRDG